MNDTNKESIKMELQICQTVTINLDTRETSTCGAKLGELFTPYAEKLFTPNYCLNVKLL